MGISYFNDVITVTGGCGDTPYSMADLVASGTTSSYVSTGGYGGNKYTVTKELVIGSTLADTCFDLTNSIIEMDAGHTLTVYSSALRGGGMPDSPQFPINVPVIDETKRKSRLENVTALYTRLIYQFESNSGLWEAPGFRVVAVQKDQTHVQVG